MELIEVILSKENLNRAYKKVVANKGVSGVDGITVEELGDYIRDALLYHMCDSVSSSLCSGRIYLYIERRFER